MTRLDYIAQANACPFNPPTLCDPWEQRGLICAANAASGPAEGFYSVPLTTYAAQWGDPTLKAHLDFLAPEVPCSPRFEYLVWSAEDTTNISLTTDIRNRGGDFTSVDATGTLKPATCDNKGLSVTLETRELEENPNLKTATVDRLLRRLFRGEILRAISLLSAAAVNTTSTWNATTGDPDAEVSAAINDASAGALNPNRVFFGGGAWSLRFTAMRGRNSAGGTASSSLTPAALGELLGADVFVGRARAATGSSGAQAGGLSVLMFCAEQDAGISDPSHIKRFVAPCEGGERIRVFEHRTSAKLITLSVEFYSTIAITNTAGIRQITSRAVTPA